MNREKVESSNLKSVGYEEDSQTLEIEFNTGAVYQYTAVPKWVFEDLMDAESVGRYFHQHIRNVYEYKQIDEE